MKIVHVQSVLPEEDVIALKAKSGASSVKEAISKAVYHYLRCDIVYSLSPQEPGVQKNDNSDTR